MPVKKVYYQLDGIHSIETFIHNQNRSPLEKALFFYLLLRQTLNLGGASREDILWEVDLHEVTLTKAIGKLRNTGIIKVNTKRYSDENKTDINQAAV